MPRIRSVHPGLFTDEAFVSLSSQARVLFIGIWCQADDFGAFEWKPVSLKMRILPADNADMPALLAELVATNTVRRYEVDGRQYAAVRNFCRYQRPKKPKAVHPMPAEFRSYVASDIPSSEPDEPQSGGGSPPAAAQAAPVPKKAELDRSQVAAVPTKGEPVPKKSEIAIQREEGGDIREDSSEPPAPYDPTASAVARAKRFEASDDGGAEAFRAAQRACVEALGGFLPEGIAPADAHFGPMMGLVDQGVPLAKILTALRSIRARPPRTPIRTWTLFAEKTVAAIAANPDASRAVAALGTVPDDAADGGRVEFPGGRSATVKQLGMVLDRGRWLDEWHGRPGEPNCKLPEWAIAELVRRGHLPEVVH